MIDKLNNLRERFSALGFQCVIRSNYTNGYSEIHHAPNDALIADIKFEHPDNDEPYIQFVYTPKCLGSQLESMRLYQRNANPDRAIEEYHKFNKMVAVLADANY